MALPACQQRQAALQPAAATAGTMALLNCCWCRAALLPPCCGLPQGRCLWPWQACASPAGRPTATHCTHCQQQPLTCLPLPAAAAALAAGPAGDCLWRWAGGAAPGGSRCPGPPPVPAAGAAAQPAAPGRAGGAGAGAGPWRGPGLLLAQGRQQAAGGRARRHQAGPPAAGSSPGSRPRTRCSRRRGGRGGGRGSGEAAAGATGRRSRGSAAAPAPRL
jgi:hypothetical protein